MDSRLGFFNSMGKIKTTEWFIERASKVHNNKYDYSKTVYVRAHDKIAITCPIHGDFLQTPNVHFRGGECPLCSRIKRVKSQSNNILERKFKGLIQPLEYKLIPLTKGTFAKVSNEDFEVLKDINWSVNHNGYAYNKNLGYIHRFIMNPPEYFLIDHINRDKLDNRRCNLRMANKSDNGANSAIRIGTSKYKGVCWDKSRNKWASKLCFNGNNIHIGRFETEIEAAKAYDAKARELFGEFAHTNF